MKYYIGEVPSEELNMFGDGDLYKVDGRYFYYTIEIGTGPGHIEDFTITDTCGRSIPLPTSMIDDFMNVLERINFTLFKVKVGEDALNSLESDEYFLI